MTVTKYEVAAHGATIALNNITHCNEVFFTLFHTRNKKDHTNVNTMLIFRCYP